MSWRPKENWDSRAIVKRELISAVPLSGMTSSQQLVEAGADAILKALDSQENYEDWLQYLLDHWEVK